MRSMQPRSLRLPAAGCASRLGLTLALAAACLSAQEAQLIVTVVNPQTGEAVTGLGPERFTVKDGDTPLKVVSVREPRAPVDILLLTDTSIVGGTVRPIADALVEQLAEDEAMAIVGFSSSAELLQDFTASKELLRKALSRGNQAGLPRVHDALYAAIDGGFEASALRKTVILLSAGEVASSSTPEAEVVELARSKRVSIFSVFARNGARNLLQRFARRTGGASFAARNLKLDQKRLAERVLEAVRNPYELTVSGVHMFGTRVAVTVGGKPKLEASVLPAE